METDLEKSLVEKWIQSLLDNKIVKPDNVCDFQSSLLEGLLEENPEKIQGACDELSKTGGEILKSEIEKLKAKSVASAILEKTALEKEIDEFLGTHSESDNYRLREEMISKLKSGDKKLLIDYIEEELPRKKVLKFREFIREFNVSAYDLILKSSQPSQDTEHEKDSENIPVDPEEKPNGFIKAQSLISISKNKIIERILIQIGDEAEETKISDSAVEGTTDHDILQKIRLIPEKKRKIWILYETYEDTSSEYRMKKIKLLEQECDNFISSLKDNKIQVRSYYGGYRRCLKLAEQYLGQKFFDTRENFSSVKNEAIIALSNGKKACLLFITADGFFTFQRKANPNALAINYIRILVDLSQVICIAPDETITLNPDCQNPYIDKPNPGFNIKEERIEPSDKVSMIQVPILPTRKGTVQEFDFSKFVLSSDFTKNLVKAQVKIQSETEMKCHETHEGSFPGVVQLSDLKNLNYPQLRNALLENWVSYQSKIKTNKPTAPKDFLITMLLKFIPNEKKADFKRQLQILVDENLKIKEDILVKPEKDFKTLVELSYDSFYQFIIDNECKKPGYFSDLFDVSPYECISHDLCLSYQIGKLNKHLEYKKIDFKRIESRLRKKHFEIHCTTQRSLESVLSQIDNELGQLETNYKEESTKKLNDCRNHFLIKVFNMVDPLVMEDKSTTSLEIQLNFYGVNILRNIEEPENFNVTLQPVALVQKFGQDTLPLPHVRSFYFLQENSGLILFSDFPPNKSSLYSFNLSNKGDPMTEFIMTLSSSESHLLIEPNLKLWCVYDNNEQRFNMGKLNPQGRPEGGAPLDVFHETREGYAIEKILSACFLPLSDSFFLINQDSDLFELKYHSKTLSFIWKKKNNGETYLSKSRIMPADPADKYVEIQTTFDGRNILLRSKKSLDIYDLNWNRIHSININDENFVKFKTFVDVDNHFLIILSVNPFPTGCPISMTPFEPPEI